MTKLYECDNCGSVKNAIKKILTPETPSFHIQPVGEEAEDEKYHVCGDCWERLGWDE